ncbi:MAG: flagellar basal-body MS-ring/collar protein FliF [Spirochaetia bacterium]|nr:flagellar basal-body MS-ring/collar protein FliF [Spirochaetia bacterium]
MPDFKQIFQKILEIVNKLDTTKKIIVGAVALTMAASVVIVVSVSSVDSREVLFKNMETKDFAKITSKLDEMGIAYKSSGTNAIFVKPADRDRIIVSLAQENLIPQGVHGWEIFDEEKWSETKIEKDVKKQRAVMGALSKMLTSIKSIEKAQVNIAFPEPGFFEDNAEHITAAVLLEYAPGVEQLKRKEIEGIVTLVSRAVAGLKKEDVSVAGPNGELLNAFPDEIDKQQSELSLVEKKLKIQETERIKMLKDIQKALEYTFGADRADIVRLDLQIRWDKETIDKTVVEPVTMVPDNPATPYSELVTKDALTVSRKKVTESFKGRGWTPEGPAGAESNVPPGYMDKDTQHSEYNKEENIENNEFNKSIHKIEKQPWEKSRVTLAVILDGRWEKKGINKDGTGYIREYHPVSDEDIAKVTDVLKKAIEYNVSRADQISVKHIQKDRSKEHEEEDEILKKRRAFRKMLVTSLVAVASIVVLVLIVQLFRRELEKSRRAREEELAAQQQMMREAALRAIEDEGIEVELSLEERARREMIENAISLAKDRPEEVAQLIRTWLAEE